MTRHLAWANLQALLIDNSCRPATGFLNFSVLRRAGFTRIIAPARFKEWAQRRRERAQKDTHKFSMNRPFVLVLLLVLLPGCSSTGTMRRQLERVAKDWSLTVRASQILPVYPLTEDLKPGDVFLVQERIEDQVRVFEARGFLPLDKHVARLSSAGFSNFYESAFGLSGATATVGPPYLWSRPLEETNHWGYARARRFLPTPSSSNAAGAYPWLCRCKVCRSPWDCSGSTAPMAPSRSRTASLTDCPRI
ncbi:MAG TPA: hypothetical protein VNU68_13285 [Verrucomicrobiae bacterium]|nr:hypothetical protein [Verrucomicrobiae bacterium]